MKSYKILVLSAFLIFSLSVPFAFCANFNVTEDEATQVAENWIDHHLGLVGNWNGDLDPYITGINAVIKDGVLLAYNIDIFPSGHILVPALKILPPVKTFSTINRFNPDSMGFEALIIGELKDVTSNINLVAPMGSTIEDFSPQNARAWGWLISTNQTPLTTGGVGVPVVGAESPPLLTTKWAQGNPYNTYTPTLNSQHTLVGCVAIAMGQIMKYHNSPATGTGTHSYSWQGQTLSMDFSTHTYQWNNMPNQLTTSSSSAQIDAVATLLRDAGYSVNMNYGLNSSGTWPSCEAFTSHFGYSNACANVLRSNYSSDNAWFQVFKTERDANRPTLFTMFTTDGSKGHAVVIDGYRDITDSNGSLINQVHINMGWSGSYDAYYALNNILTGSDLWNKDHRAWINIIPGGAPPPPPPPPPPSTSARIEIDHTYRGDLVVTVGVGNTNSPSWSTTVSNRQGGNADDLDVDVDISAGATFLPPSASNVWFLQVSDQANGDVGSIQLFRITYQGQTYTSTDPPVAINDNQISCAYIGGGGPPPPPPPPANARVEIDHTYRGDLVVVVGVGNPSSPSWSTTVSNHEGGSADNLYVDKDISAGAAFLPPSASNVWFLKVSDDANGDRGTIQLFRITYQGQIYTSTDPPVAINDFQTSYAYIGGGAPPPPPPPSANARVEIDHTYRGDLVVVVGVGITSSPSWSTVVSNRAGGGADNLDVDVDISAGAAFLPPSASNVWFLKVSDGGSWDTGSIKTFKITYQGQTYTSPDPPVAINDFQTSYAYIGGGAPPPPPPNSASARIEINHTCRGDLVVKVGVGDWGNVSWITTVSNHEGGCAHNLDMDVDISAGAAYLPPSFSNVWFLEVSDDAGGHTGTIQLFRITYQGQTYTSPDLPKPIDDFQTSLVLIP